MWDLNKTINRKVSFHLTQGFSELQNDPLVSLSCKALLVPLFQADLKQGTIGNTWIDQKRVYL